MKMPKELKDKWVEALRSGEYAQHTGALCNAEGNGYCCLGVLQMVADGKVQLDDRHKAPLGFPTREWFEEHGITRHREGGVSYMDLAGENDNGATFETIARTIEARVEGV